ncbi:hypothetical protein [Pseudomonas kribbensis]|uniref:hypothetical protein n=1 Tax=Pseudomonas kribbensis TaxID=1628086 RepID=UPI001F40FB88|nr:hypothetical protein [Pseudomonas kribbensis]UIN52884.1 hypothetical protein LXN51_17995 [Pseudomonas kribbensis]
MSCTDSLATPVKKTRHQLLYLIYGNQDVYRREAKFSILTALSQAKNGKRPAIRILTDRPQDYEGWPVDTVLLDEATLTRWQGHNGYHHRRKACAIAAGMQLAEKTLFVDTDTLFTSPPSSLFQYIDANQSVMDHPYYSACRHEWWECASREILRWDESRQKKLLNQSRWPKQLPRPDKPEDEKVIMNYLKKRVAAAR